MDNDKTTNNHTLPFVGQALPDEKYVPFSNKGENPYTMP